MGLQNVCQRFAGNLIQWGLEWNVWSECREGRLGSTCSSQALASAAGVAWEPRHGSKHITTLLTDGNVTLISSLGSCLISTGGSNGSLASPAPSLSIVGLCMAAFSTWPIQYEKKQHYWLVNRALGCYPIRHIELRLTQAHWMTSWGLAIKKEMGEGLVEGMTEWLRGKPWLLIMFMENRYLAVVCFQWYSIQK